MQVFEFHFNPKAKSDVIFDSFCFEPENIYEKRLGSLYMIGTLKNVLPQNIRFLENLARVIKEKFYKTISATSEKSLRESLRIANNHLEKIAKSGDVSWLGNLNFAVFNLRDSELNFAKAGDLKVFLLRMGHIIDVDQKLKFEDFEPYPLKIFGNIVSGKLSENDIILILTKEVYETFLKEGLLNEIANLFPFDQKKLKETFNSKKEKLSTTSGVCLLIALTKEMPVKEKEMLIEKKPLLKFSFKKVFSPLIKIFKLPKISLKKPRISIKKPVLEAPQIKLKVKIPRIKTLSFKLPEFRLKFPSFQQNKNLSLILFLIAFLALGFFIFGKFEEKQLKEYQVQLEEIQEKVNLAETYLLVGKTNPQAEKKANSLFKESWQEISPLVNIASTFPSDFANQVLNLKKTIAFNLSQLNKLEIIEKPELFFEFKAREYIPQKMIAISSELYFFSPYSQNIFELSKQGEGKILSIDKKFNLATALPNSLLFFSSSNQLVNFKDGQFSDFISLQPPYSNFNFDQLLSYQSNLYFLDKTAGKIVKYPYLGNLRWGSPQLWLRSETKKTTNFESVAVDGAIWALTKNNSIEKYYAGRLEKTLKWEIFPEPKSFKKLFTSPRLPYLYILEPIQKRVVVLDKSGQIKKQFQSEDFANLLDFAVSPDGKTIWLLNGLKVYQVKL